MVRGDAPRAKERNVKVYSPNQRFFAVSLLKEQRTAVYRSSTPKKPVWEMPGYAPMLYLADDGQHLVQTYAGGNIFDLDVRGDESFLIFFNRGKRVGLVTVGDVFPHLDQLPRSTSGRPWGNFWGFDTPTHFAILLHDNRRLTFDADTGKQMR